MKIALIYNRDMRVAMGERCQEVLQRLPELAISQFDLREIKNVTGGFDLYLRIDDGDYTEAVPTGLHPYAWWVADTHLPKPFKKIVAQAGHCDYLFCCQKDGALKLQSRLRRKVWWLPGAAEEAPSGFKLIPIKERKWDIGFIGTPGKYSLRKVMLEIVRLSYPDSFIGNAERSRLYDYYSQSRIVINYPINNDINLRIFEAMAAGALVVTHRIRDNGLQELFRDKEHLVVFDEITGDMRQKIDYYLRNPDESQRIAFNGYTRAQAEHTYRCRLASIFSRMGLQVKL